MFRSIDDILIDKYLDDKTRHYSTDRESPDYAENFYLIFVTIFLMRNSCYLVP